MVTYRIVSRLGVGESGGEISLQDGQLPSTLVLYAEDCQALVAADEALSLAKKNGLHRVKG